MRKPEHKPLSFSTTMRNPERMAAFLTCIKPFEGQILTNKVIFSIIEKVIGAKLYKTNYILHHSEYNERFKGEDDFSVEELREIIKMSPQQHYEAGFDEGWPSRFDTWYKLSMEFGFLFYEIDKKIEISSSGHMLCDAYFDINDDSSGEKIQNIFLNALIKYQSDNPFRRNANSNVPVILLLQVIKLLKDDPEESNAGLSRKEIPFITCWPNNDYNELYLFIKRFRKKHGYSASDENVYYSCLRLLNSTNMKRFKLDQLLYEGVDDFIRKMRITGIISLRGSGRFIDFNVIQKEKIDYLLQNYRSHKLFKDKYSYYQFMGDIDANIISIKQDASFDLTGTRNRALSKYAAEYSKSAILSELECLINGRASKDNLLRDIDQPTRLEFLTSLCLVQHFPTALIVPNYAIDDEGIPTFTARGGVADIEVFDTISDSTFEVTLIKSKQQAVAEIPAITRHLFDKKEKTKKKHCFSVFIAPTLHQDTKYMIGYSKHQHNLDIVGLTIKEFIEKIPEKQQVSDFLI